ncbi:MAG TPA: YraN family protein [Candidatus Polarisedimenticolia bacterium]|nr:YraN family protein [Candidatus Polarisedimenticolia bacterium]
MRTAGITVVVAEGAPPGSRRPDPRHDLGRRGEAAAARHLEALGLRILARGVRTRAGEIDLVAEEGGTLVFVEVKTRSSLAWGRPSEAVDRRKRERLTRAAAVFLIGLDGPEPPCRFDVAEVVERPDGVLQVALIRDAFQAD